MNLRIIGSLGVSVLVLLGCASGGWHGESTTAPGADLAAHATHVHLHNALTNILESLKLGRS